MIINPIIKKIIEEEGLKDDALLYLLSIYFGLDTVFPSKITNKVNSLKIVEKDYEEDTINWLIPLFGDIENVKDFIETYRSLFAEVDKTKRGDRGTVTKKLNKFLQNNPEYSQESILEATKAYIDDYCDKNHISKYLMQADYFIEKQGKGSTLLLWLQLCKQTKEDVEMLITR